MWVCTQNRQFQLVMVFLVSSYKYRIIVFLLTSLYHFTCRVTLYIYSQPWTFGLCCSTFSWFSQGWCCKKFWALRIWIQECGQMIGDECWQMWLEESGSGKQKGSEVIIRQTARAKNKQQKEWQIQCLGNITCFTSFWQRKVCWRCNNSMKSSVTLLKKSHVFMDKARRVCQWHEDGALPDETSVEGTRWTFNVRLSPPTPKKC